MTLHDAWQNYRNHVIWQPGQDYRMADALHAARLESARIPGGRERVGAER